MLLEKLRKLQRVVHVLCLGFEVCHHYIGGWDGGGGWGGGVKRDARFSRIISQGTIPGL